MRKMFKLMFVVCCFLSGAPASAMPPSGRESDGLIQSVDANNRTLTIKIEGESRLQTFEWNKDTQFLRDWKSTTSTDLKAGVAVRIRYHSPIFGKPFVTKVIFLRLEPKSKIQ